MKQKIAWILALALVLTGAPALALRAEDYYYDDPYNFYDHEAILDYDIDDATYLYTVLDDGGARILRYYYYGEEPQEVDIPAELDGHPVTSLGTSAFYSTPRLTRVSLPGSLVDIGANPFVGCPNLTEIAVPEDHPVFETIDGVLFSKPDRRLVCYPCAFTARKYAVPEGTRIIGKAAFCMVYDGYRYEEADRGLQLGDMTFAWGWLEEVALPESVTIIEEAAFAFCGELTSVTIPGSVETIAGDAFRCSRGVTVALEAGSPAHQICRARNIPFVLSDGPEDGDAWEAASVVNCDEWITLRDAPSTKGASLARIPLGAEVEVEASLYDFCRCRYQDQTGYVLRQYTRTAWEPRPATLVCGDYSYIVRDDGTAEIVRFLPADSYRRDDSVTDLMIPAELDGHPVTTIGKGAFSLMRGYARVVVPEGVTRICANAFYDASVEEEIVLPETLESIGDCAFGECSSSMSLHIPDSVTTLGSNPFPFSHGVTVSADHPALEIVDGMLFSKADKRLVCCFPSSDADVCVVPEGTEIIGDIAFYYCSDLKRIELPDSVTSIGMQAFFWCYNLAELDLPKGLTSLGEGAFKDCFNLKQITLPEGLEHIPDDAFYHCESLEALALPDSVVSIGEEAFGDCRSLSQLHLTPNIAWIGRDAFHECPELTATVVQDSCAARYCAENAVRNTVLSAEGLPLESWQPARVCNCDAWISLRAEPSTQAQKLAEIPLDAVVLVGASEEAFLKCLYDGRQGYVLAEYIEPVG